MVTNKVWRVFFATDNEFADKEYHLIENSPVETFCDLYKQVCRQFELHPHKVELIVGTLACNRDVHMQLKIENILEFGGGERILHVYLSYIPNNKTWMERIPTALRDHVYHICKAPISVDSVNTTPNVTNYLNDPRKPPPMANATTAPFVNNHPHIQPNMHPYGQGDNNGMMAHRYPNYPAQNPQINPMVQQNYHQPNNAMTGQNFGNPQMMTQPNYNPQHVPPNQMQNNMTPYANMQEKPHYQPMKQVINDPLPPMKQVVQLPKVEQDKFCPACGGKNKLAATKCRFCSSKLD